MRGGYHLEIQRLEKELADIATRSMYLMKYDGHIIGWDDILGSGNRKHNFVPRAIVWKVLHDDGMPIKSIARAFGRSRTGIQSGITRLNERLPFDAQASLLFETTQENYNAQTHSPR